MAKVVPTVVHATLTGAAANPAVLVDGPKWDAGHTVGGLSNLDDTADADKPVSTAQAAADAVVAANAANASNLTSGTVAAARMPALTGEVTTSAGAVAVTLTNSAVIGKVLTGYTSGAGSVAATDTILQAIQKLNGNDATNANLTGDVTSVGNATTLAAGNAGNLNSGTLLAARMPALTGDITTSAGAVATTLASVISAAGPIGSATVTPIITYDAKGRLTTVTSATIAPAIGSVTGLAANVAAFLATPNSTNLRAALTDETGNGAAFFQNGDLGTPNSGVATNLTGLPLTTGVIGILPIANGGRGISTRPSYYSAYSASNQTPSLATFTLINYDTSMGLTGATAIDTTNHRITPTVPGIYNITAAVDLVSTLGASVVTLYGIKIRQNGTTDLAKQFHSGTSTAAGSAIEFVAQVSTLAVFNGSTDYVDAMAYIGAGTSPTIGAGSLSNPTTVIQAWYLGPSS